MFSVTLLVTSKSASWLLGIVRDAVVTSPLVYPSYSNVPPPPLTVNALCSIIYLLLK